ncbi:MAG: hypothetical protein H6Q75_358 [Firmicutes bacterium]|nr:hypothetical protein [Bacillota bacterium]
MLRNKGERCWTFCSGVLVLVVLAALIGAWVLPNAWGDENGPLELTQAFVLLCASIIALSARFFGVGTLAMRKLIVWTIPIWLIMCGRELSWGRVFYLTQEGNMPQLSDLSYGRYVTLAIAITIIITLWGLFRSGLVYQVRRWIKYGTLPIVEIIIMLVTGFLAAWVEHYSGGVFGAREELYEELAEWVCYSAAFFIMLDVGFNKKIQPSQEGRIKSKSVMPL